VADDHEVREVRYRLKQANRTMGRQGETIHQLRGELAETRELNSKIERGQIRSLERQVAELKADLAHATAENEKLRADQEQSQTQGVS
jgi:septal ring factor EnvC (AmiA/AmiB activator)